MSKKKKHEEHENLERWLVSYADFITLLFATFVVLYALSQADVAQFSKLEEALKTAFSSKSVMEGSESILPEASTSIIEGKDISAQANPLMLEYLSQKYEDTSFNEIKTEVDKMKQEGLEAKIEDRGLVIKISNNLINFPPGSAKLNPANQRILSEIGELVFSKFQIHLIRVEGHTDSEPTSAGSMYPTNWELSSARSSAVINFFINKYKLSPKLFVVMGYADTIPLPGSDKNPGMNRRVEIVVTKNKNKSFENNDLKTLLEEKSVKTKYIKPINLQKKDIENIIENKELISPKNTNPTQESTAIKNMYENERARIDSETKKQNSSMPSFIKN